MAFWPLLVDVPWPGPPESERLTSGPTPGAG